MALSNDQKVIVAEITRQPYTTIDSIASSLNVEQESWLSDDLDLWESKRNSLAVELDGGSDGVSFKTRRLLDEIRIRVCKMFGLSIGDLTGVFAGGISKADKLARETDSDRTASMFTTNLHQQ